MDLKNVELADEYWIFVLLEKVQGLGIVNTAMNFLVSLSRASILLSDGGHLE
jgi:hypothetical protein